MGRWGLVVVRLGNGEVVLLQAEDVVFRSGNRGVFDTSAHSGSLTLTNERIIFSYSVGLIKKTEETIEIDLEDIKIFEGVLQLRPTVRKEKVGHVSLVAYLNNKEYEFEFLQKHKKKMLLFANEANKVVTGVCDCWSVEDVGGKSISKTLRGAIGTAAPVISDLAQAAKPLAPIAGAVLGSKAKVATGATGILGAVAGAAMSKTEGVPTSALPDVVTNEDANKRFSESPLSLDEQIEAMQKLKELCDAGALTEEEFLTKKKQIMGL